MLHQRSQQLAFIHNCTTDAIDIVSWYIRPTSRSANACGPLSCALAFLVCSGKVADIPRVVFSDERAVRNWLCGMSVDNFTDGAPRMHCGARRARRVPWGLGGQRAHKPTCDDVSMYDLVKEKRGIECGSASLACDRLNMRYRHRW